MDQSLAMAFLKSLWSGIDLKELKCCHCGHQMASDSALARTFCLQSQGVTDEQLCAEKFEVPTLSEVILVYHRHLECLFKSTQYVVISHVWHSQVAELQYRMTEATVCVDDVAHIVREDTARMCLGLATSLTGRFEIWHDYISVPQWQPSLKGQIIQAIPQIFNNAELTIAHLSDIDAGSVKAMREGVSVYERCRGISNICNAKWFSRIWTTMELTQSRRLRAMLKDYSVVEDHHIHHPFLHELLAVWSIEVREQGNSQTIEQMVGMGNNLVPWQLGPVDQIRLQNLRGIRTTFAAAHEVLARRCVTIPRDFFHALLGILKTNLTEPQLSSEDPVAMLQIARNCIKEGDYSPLFMIPDSVQVEPDDVVIQSYGYLDLGTFALGNEQMRPTFRDVRFRSGNPVIKADVIGVVQYIRQGISKHGPMGSLTLIIRLTLESTGLDIDAFVKTLGGRFYGQVPDKIFERLRKEDLMCQFRDKLSALHDSYPEDPDEITAWIAEAMGLSNRTLESPMSVLTPVNFLNAHGGTLHLGEAAAAVSVNCPSCHGGFLLRVALLGHESDILEARAYRVPGLKYQFTHAGGAGLLIKNGRTVGRFLWGTPTCACPKLEEVEFPLDDLPLPRPNNYEYGQQNNTEWYPLSLETRIRL